MNLINELKEYKYLKPSTLTIGVFDGVHLGHQRLISQVVKAANDDQSCPIVITFINHPASVLKSNFTAEFICSLTERIRLLKHLCIQQVIPITFDKEVANLSAKDFIQCLQDTIKMKRIVIGPDFAMGRNRSGTNITLPKLGSEMGFTVTTMQPVTNTSKCPISSTLIRKQIKSGNMASVNSQLGRNFSLDGIVVEGMKRGKLLGYPTANLNPITPDIVIPADGIYATKTLVDGKPYLSATSIGTQPTFGENDRTIESYLISFSDNLYGKHINIQFAKRIRDQKYFASTIELQKQMSKDIEETQIILSN